MNSYGKNNKSDFWKDKKTNEEIFSVVDGKTDQKEVLNIFKNKYREILMIHYLKQDLKHMIIS